MENINKESWNVISFLREKNNNLYSHELLEKTRKQALESQKIIEKYLETNKIENCSDNYYLLLYCVIFKEELINEDILKTIIDNCDNKIVPFLYITMMESKLNDEIVLRLINKLERLNDGLMRSADFGHLPFDYRYHILKREEISYDVKEKILSTYNGNIDFIREEIYVDLDNELGNKGIRLSVWDVPNEIISRYPELKDQKRALEVITNYKKQKIKKYE